MAKACTHERSMCAHVGGCSFRARAQQGACVRRQPLRRHARSAQHAPVPTSNGFLARPAACDDMIALGPGPASGGHWRESVKGNALLEKP
jgi:hypothetical protein